MPQCDKIEWWIQLLLPRRACFGELCQIYGLHFRWKRRWKHDGDWCGGEDIQVQTSTHTVIQLREEENECHHRRLQWQNIVAVQGSRRCHHPEVLVLRQIGGRTQWAPMHLRTPRAQDSCLGLQVSRPSTLQRMELKIRWGHYNSWTWQNGEGLLITIQNRKGI